MVYCMVYTIWYIPIAPWYIPSKSGIYHEATFQMLHYNARGTLLMECVTVTEPGPGPESSESGKIAIKVLEKKCASAHGRCHGKTEA